MLRFTLRDILWVTAVIALTCAWWTERAASYGAKFAHDKLQTENAGLHKAIKQAGFDVLQDCFVGRVVVPSPNPDPATPHPLTGQPPWRPTAR